MLLGALSGPSRVPFLFRKVSPPQTEYDFSGALMAFCTSVRLKYVGGSPGLGSYMGSGSVGTGQVSVMW